MASAFPILQCKPHLVCKPWGGASLEKYCPDHRGAGSVGEMWTVYDLPEASGVVSGGPLAGFTLAELVAERREELLGAAAMDAGRFPILTKLLFAREHLSVQVHPGVSTGVDVATSPAVHFAGVKHELWYVLEAQVGAEVFIGLKPGVTMRELEAAAGAQRLVDLLQRRPARKGDYFYLPSGVVHALGAGVLVAEVQNPSSLTYRLYDWDRCDAAGAKRELHIPQALANVRLDVSEDEIAPLREPGRCCESARVVCRSPAFTVEEIRVDAGDSLTWSTAKRADTADHGAPATCAVWMVLAGRGTLSAAAGAGAGVADGPSMRAGGIACHEGDALVVPAAARAVCWSAAEDSVGLVISPRD